MSHDVTVNRNIPGIVAALADGRGDDARMMVAYALEETDPALLVWEMYAYLMNGWIHLAGTEGVTIDGDQIAGWFGFLAEQMILGSDGDHG